MTDELPACDVLLPAPYDEDEWRKVRKQGIGGSDAATVMGMNPWKSAYELWLEKRSELEEDNSPIGPDDVRWWGHALEDDIAEAFELTTGLTARAAPGLLASRTDPWMLANPDRFVYDGDELVGLLEIKTTGLWRGHEWSDDELPIGALLQTHHYLMTTKLPHAWVAGLVGGQKFLCKELEPDPDLHAVLRDNEQEFWQRVLDGSAPPPDGSKSAAAAIAQRWPEATEEDGVILSPELFATVQQVRELAMQVKELTGKKDRLTQVLQTQLGEFPAGYYDDEVVVRWSNVNTKRLDQTALKEARPELFAEFTRENKSRRFTIVSKKGA